MLYNIVNKLEDKDFKYFIDYIKSSYWPEDIYKSKSGKLPCWGNPPSEADRIKKLKESLEAIVKEVCDDKGGEYKVITGDNCVFKEQNIKIKFPFLNKYHIFFLAREYDFPYRDPRNNADNIFSLNINMANKIENCSKNLGNFNHFTNVVMAAARLIQYFNECDKIKDILGLVEISFIDNSEEFLSSLIYEKPDLRTFKIMLAAFYHDIGKTIVDHRHGMEGAFIIADHTTSALFQFDNIVKQYNDKLSFEREDLLQISNFLYCHDSFGTLGTGESSYSILSEIISRIKRSSIRHQSNPSEHYNFCNKMLFDLWVLNIADIIVSRNNKLEFQGEWLTKEKSDKVINDFFRNTDGLNRIYDLVVSMNVLYKYNDGMYRDDQKKLEDIAQEEARINTAERLNRLISTTLRIAYLQNEDINKNHLNNFEQIFSSGIIHNVVIRSIQSLNDPKEFFKRLSWIVSMDYALSFFTKIASRAFKVVADDISNNNNLKTGWIISRESISDNYTDDFKEKMNAIFFLDNYCSIIVRILANLLFRERSIDQTSNIEFMDARERLINEKIDKIIGLEGPFRQNRAIEMILKTVFVY